MTDYLMVVAIRLPNADLPEEAKRKMTAEVHDVVLEEIDSALSSQVLDEVCVTEPRPIERIFEEAWLS